MNKRGFSGPDYSLVSEPSQVLASPGGKYAVYSVKTMSVQEDRSYQHLWIADPSGERVFRLTGGGSDRTPVWLSDDELLFSSGRTGGRPNETVFYSIRPQGPGEAEEYMRVPIEGARITPLGGESFLVSAEREIEGKGEDTDGWVFYDEYPYITDGGFPVNGIRKSIFLFDRGSGELKLLTDPMMQVGTPFFSPDVIAADGGFYYTGHRYTADYENVTELFFYDLESGENRSLYRAEGEIHAMVRYKDRLMLSVFFIKGDRHGCTLPVSVSVNDPEETVCYDTDFQVQFMAASASDGALYFAKNREGRSRLAVYDGCEEGRFGYSELSAGDLSPQWMAATESGLLFIAHKPWEPAEVYLRRKDGETVRLSDHGSRLKEQVTLSRGIELSTEVDGRKISGWVMPPVGVEPGKSYPAVVNIHGGPHGYFGTTVHYDNQWLAAAGYYVIICNPTGSTSYGIEFADITGEMGDRDLREILAFTEEAVRAYPAIDPSRIAVTGQSYGGYMTNMMIGKTDRFFAAVPRMGMSNWLSLEGTAIQNRYGEGCVGGDPWSAPELLWKQSPLKYVGNVKTPALIIHHEKDQCVPLEQAQQFFTALVMHGVKARLMINKNCGHGGRRISQLIHDMEVILDWFSSCMTEER